MQAVEVGSPALGRTAAVVDSRPDSRPDSRHIVAVGIPVAARNLDPVRHTAEGAAEGSSQGGLSRRAC